MDCGSLFGAAATTLTNNGDTLAVGGVGGRLVFVSEQGFAGEVLVLCSGNRLLGRAVGVMAG